MAKKTPELVAIAKAMRAEGASYERIGGQLGIDERTVRDWIDERAAAARRARLSLERQKETGKHTHYVRHERPHRATGYIKTGPASGIRPITLAPVPPPRQTP